MELTTNDHGTTQVVRIDGSLDTNTSAKAQAHFDGVLEARPTRIIVDFGGLDYISSSGLRVLLATGKKLRRTGGELGVCAMNDMATEVFEISGFSTLFQTYDTVEEALG
jgi:anti-anti-sigma factor